MKLSIRNAIHTAVEYYANRHMRDMQLWESDLGRTAGWIMEANGIPIALLSDPWYEDMFWYSYRLQYVANDQVSLETFYSREIWDNHRAFGVRWRNCYFGDYADMALPGPPPEKPGDRVTMRALDINPRLPNIIDKWVYRYRKKHGLTWEPPKPSVEQVMDGRHP